MVLNRNFSLRFGSVNLFESIFPSLTGTNILVLSMTYSMTAACVPCRAVPSPISLTCRALYCSWHAITNHACLNDARAAAVKRYIRPKRVLSARFSCGHVTPGGVAGWSSLQQRGVRMSRFHRQPQFHLTDRGLISKRVRPDMEMCHWVTLGHGSFTTSDLLTTMMK